MGIPFSAHLRGGCLGMLAALCFVGCGGSNGTSSTGPTNPGPQNVSVSVQPKLAAVVISHQTQKFTAKVNGDPKNLGVTWSVDNLAGGNPMVGSIDLSGLYTPPASGGTHIIAATSVADVTKSASASIAVTDLAGVFTYHNNLSRDGVNLQEYALTAATVNSTALFGKLFSCPVDGALYTQPLWVPNFTINGGTRNVILVATQHDSAYAFDADASPCVQLWHANLLDAAHGATPGETPVVWSDVGAGNQDLFPEIGVTSTPVIDPSTNTVYVLSKSENTSANFHQRLHALDLLTGNEKFSAPVDISASALGNGDGSSGGNVAFNAQTEGQRCGLALVHGTVYIAWASHEDVSPYHGWIIGYNASNVQQQVGVFNATPNGGLAGFWMSGAAPAADSAGNLYASTGNGTFDANLSTSPNNDFGDSVLKISTSSGLALTDWFTPFDQATLNAFDGDLGAGGLVILPDQSAGPVPHLLLGGGKEGILYLLNRDSLGHFQSGSNSQIVQSFSASAGIFDTPAFWQNGLYLAGSIQRQSDTLKLFAFNPSSGQFNPSPSSQSSHSFFFPGATPSISSQGSSNGIVWVIDSSQYGVASPLGAGPAILYAYDATNVAAELWDSTQAANNRDQAGNAVKFVPPAVANGKVYVSTNTEVDVYGLLPN